ncbi:hypothetical protein ACT3CE_08750 [Marinifilum sp. RC60d5]|uniref:hypothetical protein n=1 Tax=Marinifilum sp. RC60d5 TaxID=3458414 RepID=UPI0040361BF5
MNTLITSLESAFFHLVSLSSFDLFLILALFGIVFQLKDYKSYLSLLLALSLGSIVGLLLANMNITNFSASTIRLALAIAFLCIGIHNIVSKNLSANAIRYNYYALSGLALGTALSLHYTKIYGSGFKFFTFAGYSLGTLSAYLIISFVAILISTLIVVLFKTDRRSFNLVISGIGIGIALVFIYLRC